MCVCVRVFFVVAWCFPSVSPSTNPNGHPQRQTHRFALDVRQVPIPMPSTGCGRFALGRSAPDYNPHAKLLGVPSPFFPGILLSRTPPETQGKRIQFLKRPMAKKEWEKLLSRVRR